MLYKWIRIAVVFPLLMLLLCGCKTEMSEPLPASSEVTSDDIMLESQNSSLAFSGSEAGQLLADVYLQNKENPAVVAYVNGEPIYQRDFLVAKKRAEISSTNAMSQISAMDQSEEEKTRLREQFAMPDDDSIVQDLIQGEVIRQEAERRHLTVSDEEACAYGENVYKQMQQAAADDPQNQPDLDLINAYMSALGLSPEEYFKTVAVEGYKSYLLKNKLYESVYAEFTEEQKSSENAYEDYIKTLVGQAEVTLEH